MNFRKFLTSDYKDYPVYNIRNPIRQNTRAPPAEEPKPLKKPGGRDYVKDILENHNIFAPSDVEDSTADEATTNLSNVDEVSTLSSKMKDEVLTEDEELEIKNYYRRIAQTNTFRHDFNPHLEPIRNMKEQIVQMIETNQVSLVTGRTGCGKTTQIPQFIFDSCREREAHCNIIVTQPRRIAAISVARRVAEERKWPLGSIVGYKVSMNSEISPETRILYCTAGILLQMLIMKKSKIPYTHIFIDEVHERNDETDFLLIVLKWIISNRKARVKVVLMSATMDVTKFADYFSFSTRTTKYIPSIVSIHDICPFEVEYFFIEDLRPNLTVDVPHADISDPRITDDVYAFAADVIRRLPLRETLSNLPLERRELGAVLVFLPGFYEIEHFFEVLSKMSHNTIGGERWSLFPLHSTTAFEEQKKVFEKAENGCRKIILATNIAESSLTVADVTYVVDFCLVKIAVQKEDTNYMSLELSWISKSQGAQRAGRVGRVSNGFVFRIVPRYLYDLFDDDCTPEILRSPLDTLVLKAKQLNLGPPAVVLAHAIDPPKLDNIHRTILSLKEMGALMMTVKGVFREDDGDFTSIGAIIAALPLASSLSKLIVLGHFFSCLEDCIIMACAMSVKNLFSNPFKKELNAYNSRLNWSNNSSSDPLSYLNVYKLYKSHKATGVFRRSGAQNEHVWCQKQYVQLRSLKEIECLEHEIVGRLAHLNIRKTPKKDEPQWSEEEKPLILKFLLAGACYPNYFLCAPIIEEEAVKTLNGNNPYCTVYLKNFPTEQPKLLYQEVIRRKFMYCGSGIDISFDGSQKVYVHFKNSSTNASALDRDDKNGRILLAVYRACKIAHTNIRIEIPMLSVEDAMEKNKELYGESNQLFLPNMKTVEDSDIGIRISVLKARVVEVVNPQCFWIQLVNETHEKKLFHISQLMLNPDMMAVQREYFEIGSLIAAPFQCENETIFYRAKITNIDRRCTPRLLEVLFIDYGNTIFVKENEVRAFTEAASSSGLVDEPPLALKCSLAKIAPALSDHLVGIWTQKAKEEFEKFLPDNSECIVKIYSSVEGTMNVHLFKAKSLLEHHCKEDTLEEKSLNNHLIGIGVAVSAEEPYLSRENNAQRVEASSRSDMSLSYSKANKKMAAIDQQYLYENSQRMVRLKGPYSPLAVKLNGATKKSISMDISIDQHSVNSVLLDSYPEDPSDRFVAANAVTQSSNRQHITLRETSVMPNIHGLYYLITMIFSPYVELKHDNFKSQYVGALCGLGYDEQTGKSYYPENEINLNFDTVIDNDDILLINRIRHYFNYALKDETSGFNAILNESKVQISKKWLAKLILQLLKKRRDKQDVGFVENSEIWGKGFDPTAIFKPQLRIENENFDVFKLINVFKLERKERTFNSTAYLFNLQQMGEAVKMLDSLKTPISCLFCKETFKKLMDLKMHLYTNKHIEKVKQFNELMELESNHPAENKPNIPKNIYNEFYKFEEELSLDEVSITDKESTVDDRSTIYGDDDATSEVPSAYESSIQGDSSVMESLTQDSSTYGNESSIQGDSSVMTSLTQDSLTYGNESSIQGDSSVMTSLTQDSLTYGTYDQIGNYSETLTEDDASTIEDDDESNITETLSFDHTSPDFYERS